MTHRWTLLLALLASSLGLTACAGEQGAAAIPTMCGDANSFSYDGNRYCIVIEEGFLTSDCPDDLPQGREFDDFTACTDADAVPDEIAGEGAARGIIPSCTDGANVASGCVECTCVDEAWVCSDEACECVEGETRREDCNTCDCDAGLWVCTTMACACEDGETREEDCNTCLCEAGDWVCTDEACLSPFEECIAGCDGCLEPDDERVEYVAEDAESCEGLRYDCPDGWEAFSNPCGCGCVFPQPVCADGETMGECDECTCVDGQWSCSDEPCRAEFLTCLETCLDCERPDDPAYEYTGFSAEECASMGRCEDPIYVDNFSNGCGCGCVLATAACEDGDRTTTECSVCECIGGEWRCETTCDDFKECLETCRDCEPDAAPVRYTGRSADACRDLSPPCGDGWRPFNNACGCGCILAEPCEPGARAEIDCNTCSCTADGLWECTTDACECTEGETREEDCNTCTCEAGTFLCTTELCEGCVGACADDCTPPPGDRVRLAEFGLPETCREVDDPAESGRVLVTMRTLADTSDYLACELGSFRDFDWETNALLRVAFIDNPDARIDAAYVDAGAATSMIHLVAPAYCGGPRPESTTLYFAIPRDARTEYRLRTCTYGTCDEVFP